MSYGHVRQEIIQNFFINFNKNQIFLICGPPLMVSHVKNVLKEMNYNSDYILNF